MSDSLATTWTVSSTDPARERYALTPGAVMSARLPLGVKRGSVLESALSATKEQ